MMVRSTQDFEPERPGFESQLCPSAPVNPLSVQQTASFRVSIKWGDHSLFTEFSLEVAFQKVVQFSRSVVSHSLQPHEPQHARPPYPSTTPRVYPNHVH